VIRIPEDNIACDRWAGWKLAVGKDLIFLTDSQLTIMSASLVWKDKPEELIDIGSYVAWYSVK
jgi:hypothetical protein